MNLLALSVWLLIGFADEPCQTIETTVSGDSMEGILWNGQKITAYTRACGVPNRYDHLLFTHPSKPNAIVKQIWGMPGDTLRIGDKNQLFINSVEAKTPFGRPYILIRLARNKLRMLEGKPLEGYLVLGHPGSEDSTRFGLIPAKSVLGYVKRDEPYAGN